MEVTVSYKFLPGDRVYPVEYKYVPIMQVCSACEGSGLLWSVLDEKPIKSFVCPHCQGIGENESGELKDEWVIRGEYIVMECQLFIRDIKEPLEKSTGYELLGVGKRGWSDESLFWGTEDLFGTLEEAKDFCRLKSGDG